MTPLSSHLPKVVAATAAAIALAAPVAASAAPDWTPAKAFPNHALPSVGYANGEETEAHLELLSESPIKTRVVVTATRLGDAPQTQLEVPTTASGLPVDVDLAVAPSGQAVIVWCEVDGTGNSSTPARFRVAYRSAAGDWEPPVTVVADELTKDNTGAALSPAIGPDGTAAVVINHHEKDDAGEAVHDQRADVVVHPPGRSWEPPFRLSAPNRSTIAPEVGIDAAGNITATYSERYNETTQNTTALVRRRSPSNNVWTTADDITHSAPNGHGFAPHLAVAPDGRAVIALQDGFATFAAVRDSATGSFGGLTRVNATDTVASAADAAIAPDGTAYVAYRVSSGPESPHVGLVRAAPGASFTAPRRVSPTGVDGVQAEIAFAGKDAVVGWTGQLAGSGTDVVQGTRWAAGSPLPDAFRDLDAANGDRLAGVTGDGEGSALVLWANGLDSHSAAFDGGAPAARTAAVPQAATAGEPVIVRGSFADRWSPLAGEPRWDFGDGTTATGGELTHVWATGGDYTVTLRSADAFGNTNERRFEVHVNAPAAPAGQPPAAAPLAPRVAISLPKCARKLSKAACKRFRLKPAAWARLRGTAGDASRVTVTVKRKGAKTVTVKTTVKSGKWAARLKGLKAGGTTTISAQAFAAGGAKSKPAARKLKLRR